MRRRSASSRPNRPVRRARVIATLLVAVLACGGTPRGSGNAPIGLTLPALHGGDIELARYRGEPVVLHLFTTWSLAAQLDVPQLSEIARSGDQVEVVGIALDPDGYDLVAPWARESGVPYLVTLATDPIRRGSSPLGPIGEVPTTIIVDPSGRIAHKLERPLQPGELRRLLRGLQPQ
jgi:peroxiredoxin